MFTAHLDATYDFITPGLTQEEAFQRLLSLYSASVEAEQAWFEFSNQVDQYLSYQKSLPARDKDNATFKQRVVATDFYNVARNYFIRSLTEEDLHWFIVKTVEKLEPLDLDHSACDDAVNFLTDEGLYLYIISEKFSGYSLYSTSLRDFSVLLQVMVMRGAISPTLWERLWVTSNLNRTIKLNLEVVFELNKQELFHTLTNSNLRASAAMEGVTRKYPIDWIRKFCETGVKPENTSYSCDKADYLEELEQLITPARLQEFNRKIFILTEEKDTGDDTKPYVSLIRQAETREEEQWILINVYANVQHENVKNYLSVMGNDWGVTENVCKFLRAIQKLNPTVELADLMYRARQSVNFSGVLAQHLITCFDLRDDDMKILFRNLDEDLYTEELVAILMEREIKDSVPLRLIVAEMRRRDDNLDNMPDAWVEELAKKLYTKVIAK